ncbi:hypothetical protein [uncultured Ruegeria sp.]|uniref:hypothetical protein n=1 Tax=uncultured Ruegeria sp. TaxID=259304 RepID=UPI0026150986|nr:hypothetical protein [uncultured Ruegeria sp.]
MTTPGNPSDSDPPSAGQQAMLRLLRATQQQYETRADEIQEEPTEDSLPEDRREVLEDLQFLTPGADSDTAAERHLLRDAIATPEFAQMLRRPGMPELEEPDEVGIEALYQALSELLSMEGARAHLAGFKRRPERGERSLWSRVVKARLRRIAVEPVPVPSQPWSEGDELCLRRLAALVTGPGLPPAGTALRSDEWRSETPVHYPGLDSDAWVAISGDLRLLLDMLRKNAKWRDRCFIARSQDDLKLQPVRARKLHIDLDGRLRRKRFSPNNPRAMEAADQVNQPDNRLGVRLIKLRMWQLGYYQGDLSTSLFAEGARRLFLELGDARQIADRKGHLITFLGGVGDTMIAINPHWLSFEILRKLDRGADPHADEAEIEKFAEEAIMVNSFSAEQEPDLRAQSRSILRRRRIAEGPPRFKTPLRMLRQAFYAVGRGFRGLGRAIRDLVAPLRNLLLVPLTAFRKLARAMSRSILQFKRFLFGQPFGEYSLPGPTSSGESVPITAVYSQYSLSRSAETYVIGRPEVTLPLIKIHKIKIARMLNALGLGLEIGMAVINFVLPTSRFINVIKLTFRLLGILRRRIVERMGRPALAV